MNETQFSVKYASFKETIFNYFDWEVSLALLQSFSKKH